MALEDTENLCICVFCTPDKLSLRLLVSYQPPEMACSNAWGPWGLLTWHLAGQGRRHVVNGLHVGQDGRGERGHRHPGGSEAAEHCNRRAREPSSCLTEQNPEVPPDRLAPWNLPKVLTPVPVSERGRPGERGVKKGAIAHRALEITKGRAGITLTLSQSSWRLELTRDFPSS